MCISHLLVSFVLNVLVSCILESLARCDLFSVSQNYGSTWHGELTTNGIGTFNTGVMSVFDGVCGRQNGRFLQSEREKAIQSRIFQLQGMMSMIEKARA